MLRRWGSVLRLPDGTPGPNPEDALERALTCLEGERLIDLVERTAWLRLRELDADALTQAQTELRGEIDRLRPLLEVLRPHVLLIERVFSALAWRDTMLTQERARRGRAGPQRDPGGTEGTVSTGTPHG